MNSIVPFCFSGIIPQDLRHEETIVQISEALKKLTFAANHIFDSLGKRLQENSKRYLQILLT